MAQPKYTAEEPNITWQINWPSDTTPTPILNAVFITKSTAVGRNTIENPEQEIAYAARISSAKQGKTDIKEDIRLIYYCYTNGHYSIFQTFSFSIVLKTSREVARQFMRHWSLICSYALDLQEQSQRYEEVNIKSENGEVEFFIKEFRLPIKNNRQASFKPDECDYDLTLVELQKKLGNKVTLILKESNKMFTYRELNNVFQDKQKAICVGCYAQYQKELRMGNAKETARTILPEGGTVTEIYVNGTVRSWITYLQSRYLQQTGQPQYEHVQLAEAIAEEFKKKFPNIFAAMIEDHQRQQADKLKVKIADDLAQYSPTIYQDLEKKNCQ